MKPIRIWLELLPEPYRTQAMEETTRQHQADITDNIFADGISDALDKAFDWWATPQGFNYWAKIAHKAEYLS